MHLLKIWLALISMLLCGCSLQQQTDKAEQVWLNASAADTVLHGVNLKDKNSPDDFNTFDVQSTDGESNQQPFLTAVGANTYYRGRIQSTQIRELSGIAPVLGESDKYWAINDSGNQPVLYAFDGTGRHLAAIDLAVRNRDWEDMSSYSYMNENWIAVAETGDNLLRHPVSAIHIFRQPDLHNAPTRIKPYQRIDFSYPDGPRNVESIAISVAEGRIYLIAKDNAEAGLYTLPLAASHQGGQSGRGPLIATRVGRLGKLNNTEDDVWWERLFAGRILLEATAADISADDRTAVVTNYRHVYLFKRRGSETWASALARTPEIISSHRMQQSEAVAFSAQSDQVIVSSEGLNAPLLAIRPSR